MNNDIGKKIIDKIKAQKIEPKAKWQFVLKNYAIWVLFGLSIIIGSLAVSAVIYLIKNSSQINQYSDLNFASKVLIVIPYFWLIILVGFIAVAYYNIKHTKSGYKLNPFLIVTVSILASIIFGVTGFAFGVGDQVEDKMYQKFPIYKMIHNQQMKPLHRPEKGLLMGVVLEQLDDYYWVIDVAGQKWTVYFSETLPLQKRIMFLGEALDNYQFKAKKALFFNCPHCSYNNNNFINERKMVPKRIIQ